MDTGGGSAKTLGAPATPTGSVSIIATAAAATIAAINALLVLIIFAPTLSGSCLLEIFNSIDDAEFEIRETNYIRIREARHSLSRVVLAAFERHAISSLTCTP